jgi:hypothetical protein
MLFGLAVVACLVLIGAAALDNSTIVAGAYAVLIAAITAMVLPYIGPKKLRKKFQEE